MTDEMLQRQHRIWGLRPLFRVVFEKEYAILKRYWINTAAGLIANYVMFILIFFGGQEVAPSIIEGNITGLIVGWFIWTMSWSSFQQSAQTLTREATWGTLEQTYMNPHGLFPVVTARILVQLCFTVLTGTVMLILLMATTNHWIVINPLTVFPIAFVTMASATGLGFAFGGLALIYKQVSSTFIIVQFLLLGAIASPQETIMNILPLSWGTNLLARAMDDGVHLWQLPILDIVGVVVVSLIYVLFGYAIFRYSVKITKSRGIMGHY